MLTTNPVGKLFKGSQVYFPEDSDLCFAPSRFPNYQYLINQTDTLGNFTYFSGIETYFGDYTEADCLGTLDLTTGAYNFIIYFNCPDCIYDSRDYIWSVQDDKWGAGSTWAYYKYKGFNKTDFDGPNDVIYTQC